MILEHRWMQVAWPLALLALFGFAFRGQASRAAAPDAAAACAASQAIDLDVLERCSSLESDDIELMLELGHRYEAAARWHDAERLYRRALAVDARDGDVRLRLGQALLELGDTGGARHEAEAALAVQPGRAAAVRLLGRANLTGAPKP